ncbi:MAG: NAD(P)/FAD-dependent oxidoreductase [Burkholderiaceae bacterium]
MKIAVVGSGISGLSAAWQLSRDGHEVALYEAGDYFGGHTHTVDVDIDGQRFGVDTGFLVFNHRTYPNLVRLFEQLDVHTSASDMSFAVKMPMSSDVGSRTLEWAGSNLDTVFAQRRNLLSPRFWRMLRDIVRFNRQTTELALTEGAMDEIPLGDFLNENRYSTEFRDWYLLPMAGCIWSCPTEQMLAFPLATFVRFCHNHGLIQVNNRPQWHTVTGGARHYVEKMLAIIAHPYLNTAVTSVRRVPLGSSYQVRIESARGMQLYDHVVLAAHSDQSLKLLHDVSDAEHAVLAAVGYQPNLAVLHTDASCLPQSRKAWSAWNYESAGPGETNVCVHYLLNKLQPLPVKTPVIVSLNPIHAPDPEKVLASFDYAHPVFDGPAVDAQRKLRALQGRRNTWFAGAWTGYGFHEDGLKSGSSVAAAIAALADAPVRQAA